MRVSDSLRVEPIYDTEHGRRFQILAVNRNPSETFSVHRDLMGREYVKLKLSEAEIMLMIQELQKNITDLRNDPVLLEKQFRKNRLKVVTFEGDSSNE